MATFECSIENSRGPDDESVICCGDNAAVAASNFAADRHDRLGKAVLPHQRVRVLPLDAGFHPSGDVMEFHVRGRVVWETDEVRRASPD